MSDPLELPPAELVRLVDRVWRQNKGRKSHVMLRLDFGLGRALTVRVGKPVMAKREEWDVVDCGEVK